MAVSLSLGTKTTRLGFGKDHLGLGHLGHRQWSPRFVWSIRPPHLLHMQTVLLHILCWMTSSSAHFVITMASGGCSLTIHVIMGHNNLLARMTYTAVFVVRTGCVCDMKACITLLKRLLDTNCQAFTIFCTVYHIDSFHWKLCLCLCTSKWFPWKLSLHEIGLWGECLAFGWMGFKHPCNKVVWLKKQYWVVIRVLKPEAMCMDSSRAPPMPGLMKYPHSSVFLCMKIN